MTAAEFWTCVRDGQAPVRSQPVPAAPSPPADLVHLLISRVGLTDDEVRAMTKGEAVARLQRYCGR